MIKGKGQWVWKVDQLLNVHPTLEAAVDEFVRCGAKHVLVKVCNGWLPWLPDTIDGKKIPKFLELCRKAGLQIILWTYSYCHTIPGETSAIRKALTFYSEPGDLFVIDAEQEYKKNGNGTYYKTLVKNIRATSPNMKIGYSSYRFPSLHQEIDWGDLTEASDFTIPQVYWEGAHNPGQQLVRSLDEYKKFSKIPFIAAGAAYTNKGWTPTDDDIEEFSNMAHSLGIPAINLWRWDTTVSLKLWDMFCRLDWGDGLPPQLTDKEKLDRLWADHPELHPPD